MIRQFTPPGLHLSGPRLRMGMSLIYYDSKIVFTVKNKPKQAETVVEMNSEDRNKLSTNFISPETENCSPMQLHFPHGPNGSPSFPEEKNG